MAASPLASATPQKDLWNLINDKHVAAGCAPYGHAQLLSDISLEYAQMMANNHGSRSINDHGVGGVPVLDRELHNRGYNFSYLGELDYSNTNGGGSPQAALDYWLANPTRDLINSSDITQMDASVVDANGVWAASSILATPS
jgi:hypothetical protein